MTKLSLIFTKSAIFIRMQLTINNQSQEIRSHPDTPLLWALRDELGLVGTKFGCGGGYCGSCTVHVDGEATRSCVTFLRDIEGKSIRTVEDLATIDVNGVQFHPIQQAFIDEQVPQCAYCMNGQMMTALAFLQKNATPSDDQIVEAMGNNYCRCGCYVRIKKAVGVAAEMLAQNAGGAA